MKVHPSQFEALAAATMDRVRRERLLELRQRGFEVTEDRAANALLIRDAAGCEARVESRGLRTRIVSPEGRVIETEQYPGGRIRRIVDATGREVRFERDADGFLLAIDRGAQGGRYLFKLSPDWKPLSIEYPDGTTWSAEYSPARQPERLVQRDGSEIRYSYGPGGALTSLTDSRGNTTRISADRPGSPSHVEFPTGDQHVFVRDGASNRVDFEVNGKSHAQYWHQEQDGSLAAFYRDGGREHFVFRGGQLVKASNAHATVLFEYDRAGRLMAESVNGRTVRYLRNEVGSLVGLVTPDGETIAYERDRDQRLVGISGWKGGRFEIVQPPAGPPLEVRYPNGVVVRTRANAMGYYAEWSVRRGSGEVLDSAQWEYDLCDRLTTARRGGSSRGYRYDRGGRLTAVDCREPRLNEGFELDPAGNVLRIGGAACAYDAMNRLVRQGRRTFRYDGLGNLATEGEGRQDVRYIFNGRGQLIRMEAAGLDVEYAYDPLGRRIRKKTGGVTTQFDWAGTQLLSETIDDGKRTIRRDYCFCPEFLNPLAFREGESAYYIHSGRLHEPLCVTDAGGGVAWRAEYLAFGHALVSTERVRLPLRLPGQYYDDETGLHYSVGRYYHPELGRFLSMDPHRAAGASLNYYTYCDGDPVNRLDPTGEIGLTLGTVLTAMAIGAAAGAAIGAGIEAYREHSAGQRLDWGQIGQQALIGGCLGGIGAAVGTVAAAAIGATALGAAVGVVGTNAIAGGLASGAQYCVQAAGEGHWNWAQFGTDVVTGTALSAVMTVGGAAVMRSLSGRGSESIEQAAEAVEKARTPLASEVSVAEDATGEISGDLAGAAEDHLFESAQKAAVEPPPATRPATRFTNGPIPAGERTQMATDWYAQHNPETAASRADGYNPQMPLEIKTMSSGEQVAQWVRDDGKPGIDFTTPDTDPATLGLKTDSQTGLPTGRHLEIYEATQPVQVLQGTARDFPDGVAPLVGGKGGGTQIAMPPGWQGSFKRVR